MDLRKLAFDLNRSYLQDLDGLVPASLTKTLLGWNRARNVAKLASCYDSLAPEYQGALPHEVLRQCAAFFKKNKAFTNDDLCEEAAALSFEKGEKLCRITNRRLDHYYENQDRLDPRLRGLVRRSEQIIAEVLGDVGPFFKSSFFEGLRVTSGATATQPRIRSFPYLKMKIRGMECTRDAMLYLSHIGNTFGYPLMSFKICNANRVVTVPKNWKTARTIAAEPTGNLFLQLCVDAYIKGQLKRKLGIDLGSQARNQSMAKQGSVFDNLSTIDLSMASDTVAYNTVGWLFPNDWFRYLDHIRSPKGIGFGKTYEYAKFSSMGNGATFTIETLIFAAFCKAVGSKNFSVYGDDIIIEKELVNDLFTLLKFFGFVPNTEKSYITGPFRESCGADWYEGQNITPRYIKNDLILKVNLIHTVNVLAGIAIPDGKLEKLLLSIVKEHNLPLVPFTENTTQGVWLDPHTCYRAKILRSPRGTQLTKYKALVPQTRKVDSYDSRGLFLWHLDAMRRDRPLSSLDVPKEEDICDVDLLGRDVIVRSRYHASSHKYVRKWVHWLPPVVASPHHLYRWSDLLARKMLA